MQPSADRTTVPFGVRILNFAEKQETKTDEKKTITPNEWFEL